MLCVPIAWPLCIGFRKNGADSSPKLQIDSCCCIKGEKKIRNGPHSSSRTYGLIFCVLGSGDDDFTSRSCRDDAVVESSEGGADFVQKKKCGDDDDPPSQHDGAYSKNFHRCLSRLEEKELVLPVP